MEDQINIQTLYERVKNLGLANNQYVFSRMCGRTPAWFSCIKSQKKHMTPAAAMTLSVNLRVQAGSLDNPQHDEALALSDLLINATFARLQRLHIGCPQ
jgi:hypothetical protein